MFSFCNCDYDFDFIYKNTYFTGKLFSGHDSLISIARKWHKQKYINKQGTYCLHSVLGEL